MEGITKKCYGLDLKSNEINIKVLRHYLEMMPNRNYNP
jgi:hypothetical protein